MYFSTPLFADWGGFGGWLLAGGAAAIVLLIASLTTNVIQFMTWWKNASKERRTDTVGEYEALLRKCQVEIDLMWKRQDKASARHETEINSLQAVVAILSERCNDCDVDMEGMYGVVRVLHGIATRQAASQKNAGLPYEEVPPMPRKPQRRYPDAQFLQKTVSQFTGISKAADSIPAGAVALPDTPPQEERKGEDPGGG